MLPVFRARFKHVKPLNRNAGVGHFAEALFVDLGPGGEFLGM